MLIGQLGEAKFTMVFERGAGGSETPRLPSD